MALSVWATLTALGVLTAAPSMDVQPTSARPGDAVRILVTNVDSPPEGLLHQSPLLFLPFQKGFLALAGLPVEASSGPMRVTVRIKGGITLSQAVTVLPANFPRRQLKVSPKFTSPPASVKMWMAEDKKAFKNAFSSSAPIYYFEDSFSWPREGPVTAPFGDLRLFNGKKKSQHFGTDIEGNEGDAVFAAHAGRVMMRRECYAAGNTVIIHHGGTLFTAYFHLSSFDVKDGDEVKKGQRIGAVGKTGRVTGPHLHFGAKIDNLWVNPESLLRLNFGDVSDLSKPEASSQKMP